MPNSPILADIYKAIAQFQDTCPPVIRGSVNDFFNARYASLPQLKEIIDGPLLVCGLMIVQPTRVTEAGDNVLVTQLVHIETGQFIESEYKLTAIKGNDPQSQGSALSYARRYQMLTLLNLVAEDDDANSASRPPQPKQAAEPQADESVAAVDWDAKLAACKTEIDVRTIGNEAWTAGVLGTQAKPSAVKKAIDARIAELQAASSAAT